MIRVKTVIPPMISILGRTTSLAFALWILVALGAVFLTTLGTDEAWVLNGLKSLLTPWSPNISSEPISTNGGLFALANIFLEFVFGNEVWFHRLFSLGCLLAIVGAMLSGWTSQRSKMSYRLLYVAPLLALPGTAEIGTTALGTSTALLLLLLVSLIWTSSERPGIGRIITCGLLFGLSASSRSDLILFAPALLIAECFRANREKSFGVVAPAFVVIAIGLTLFVANQIWLSPSVDPAMTKGAWDRLLDVTGIRSSLVNYPLALNRLSLGIGFLPPAMIVASFACIVWPLTPAHIAPEPLNTTRFKSLLFIVGVVLWMNWMLWYPIPHLRYIWPSLVCFAILLGFLLVQVFSNFLERQEWQKAMICQAIALVMILMGIAGSTRNIVMGETDYMSWEWSGEMGRDYFRRFQHVQDQTEAFNYIKGALSPDSVVLSYLPYALRYKTDRPILDANAGLPGTMNGQEYYLVLTPGIGTYIYLNPQTYSWIETNAGLQAQFGRYSIYKLKVLPPVGSGIFKLSRSNYVGHPLSNNWFGR